MRIKYLLFCAVLGFAVSTLAFSRPSGRYKRANSVSSSSNQGWAVYLGDNSRSHYSTADQINKSNVSRLKVAWIYETGKKGEWEDNPLEVDGVIYIATTTRKVIALNAATGEQLWSFDAETVRPGGGVSRQRGLAYWASGDDRRIYTAVGSYLYALEARTGRLIRSFGQNGSVNLASAVKAPGGYGAFNVFMNAPGVIFKGLYIVGVSGGPGTVQAYNVRTGKLKWVFYTIPRPGEYGYLSWPPDAYKTIGGAYEWAGAALDEKRGIVYVPTSQPDSSFWGGNRIGADLFANSLVALDANTGKLLWYFQGVHHDLLDRDLADIAPDLVTVTRNGRKIDVVAQGDKIGELFVFDRATGEPVWPIYERPVPQTKLPGEQTWPTQPFPSEPPPLMRQVYTKDDVSNISPEAHALTLRRFEQDGSEGPYPAPGLKETIMFPGFDGGMEWGGAAVDPEGIYYVNLNEVPWLLQMVPTKHADGSPMSLGERGYTIECASCHGLNRRGDPSGGFPSLANIARELTKGQVTQIVLQGGGRMPSFGGLPEPERQAIIDFLFGNERPAEAYLLAQGSAKRNEGRRIVDLSAPYAFTGFHRWLDGQGYPAIKPPWGILTAVDLNTGNIKWKVPLGEYPELTAKGIPPTGTENYGGPIVTAGGLIFIGATEDGMFRAFDKDTGKVLWQAKLPFDGTATPSTYITGGRQYVVIPCGGAKGGRPSGGTLVAFTLP